MARLSVVVQVLLLFLVGSICVGGGAVSDLEYREESHPVASSSSSSYDYWWPYPPGIFAPPTLTPTPTPSSAGTLSETATAIVETNKTLSSTGSDSVTTSSTSSTSSWTTTQTSSTATIVSTASHPASPILWVVPVLVGVGLLSTGLVLWFCYGILEARRGPRPRASSLEPGPRYVPGTPGQRDDEDRLTAAEEKVGLNEIRPVLPLRYTWTQRILKNHTGTTTVVPPDESVTAFFAWPDPTPKGYFEHIGTTPPQQRIPPAHKDDDDDDDDPLSLLCDEEDVQPYDSLRHQSIRRGILERLKFGTLRIGTRDTASSGRKNLLRSHDTGTGTSLSSSSSFRRVSARPPHVRADSDFLIEDMDDTTDGSRWVAGSGFRIVEESLDAMWQAAAEPAEPISGLPKIERESTGSANETTTVGSREGSDDPYTPLPVRKQRSWPRVGTPRYDGLPRVDSSILPRSPPQITSPQLESRLLFTPVSPPPAAKTGGAMSPGRRRGLSVVGKRGSGTPMSSRQLSSHSRGLGRRRDRLVKNSVVPRLARAEACSSSRGAADRRGGHYVLEPELEGRDRT